MPFLIGSTSCRLEEAVVFLGGEEVVHMADGLPKFLVGSSCGFSDECLELCEDYFDRVAGGADAANHVIAIESDNGNIRVDADGDFTAAPVVIGSITAAEVATLTADNFVIV